MLVKPLYRGFEMGEQNFFYNRCLHKKGLLDKRALG
jgi:hypothetical protein